MEISRRETAEEQPYRSYGDIVHVGMDVGSVAITMQIGHWSLTIMEVL